MNTESLWPEPAPEWAAPYDHENDGETSGNTEDGDPMVVWVGPRRGDRARYNVYARIEREDTLPAAAEDLTVVHGRVGIAVYLRGDGLVLDLTEGEAMAMVDALSGALEDLRHTVRPQPL